MGFRRVRSRSRAPGGAAFPFPRVCRCYTVPVTFVRTREDALDALGEILDLEDRAVQIVRVTGLIGICLHEDPRRFLVDCQASLIENGLESLRRRRKESITKLRL